MLMCLVAGVLRVSAQPDSWLHRVAALLSVSLATIVQESPISPSPL